MIIHIRPALENTIVAADHAQSLAGQEQDNRAGKLLAALRKRAGVTQDELAGMINISRITLGFWENGHFPIATAKLQFIATALRLSPQDLDRLSWTPP
jgi:DNA-binding XRE family transcriptional regulator